jgi:anaerobic magnesium-protoporphyrin IX monomethyl ester cyclase
MKILLLSFTLQNNMFPLGLNYIKNYAKKHHPNTNIQIKEFTFGNKSGYETNKNIELQALSYIKLNNPDIVAFSCYIWNFEMTKDFARAIKLINNNIKIIVGGVEISSNLVTQEIDFFIAGEGEIAFSNIISHLKNQLPIEEVNNVIYYNNKTNQLVENKKEYINNLDTIPFPYESTNNNSHQSNQPNTQINITTNNNQTNNTFDVLRLETTRGCHFKCNFCHYGKPTFREFSIQYLKTNIPKLFQNYNFKTLTILDANFNYNNQRMQTILNIIKTEHNHKILKNKLNPNLKLNLHIELRPELITKEIITTLEQTNFNITAELGLQSTDKDVQKQANRPTNIDKVKQALQLLEQSKINYKIDLMHALASDNIFKFLNSCKFILNNATSQKQIISHHLMMLNNTTYFDNKQELNLIRYTPNSSSMIIKTNTQDVFDLYKTKLYLDMTNAELKLIR